VYFAQYRKPARAGSNLEHPHAGVHFATFADETEIALILGDLALQRILFLIIDIPLYVGQVLMMDLHLSLYAALLRECPETRCSSRSFALITLRGFRARRKSFVCAIKREFLQPLPVVFAAQPKCAAATTRPRPPHSPLCRPSTAPLRLRRSWLSKSVSFVRLKWSTFIKLRSVDCAEAHAVGTR
jgi:hypothetical protein